VVDSSHTLLGIFTDGDFRRNAEKDMGILNQKVSSVMTKHPITVCADALAVEALKVVEDRKINSIVVTSGSGKVAGFIDVQDLPGFKLM